MYTASWLFYSYCHRLLFPVLKTILVTDITDYETMLSLYFKIYKYISLTVKYWHPLPHPFALSTSRRNEMVLPLLLSSYWPYSLLLSLLSTFITFLYIFLITSCLHTDFIPGITLSSCLFAQSPCQSLCITVYVTNKTFQSLYPYIMSTKINVLFLLKNASYFLLKRKKIILKKTICKILCCF